MTTTFAASARGLTKVYGKSEPLVYALAGVDLHIDEGKFTAIMGPSGSGKSTLMHCLAGLDQATSGAVEIASQNLTVMDDRTLTRFRRENIGFIFQAFNLLPALTAKQNILLPLELAGRKVDQQWFLELTAILGLQDRLSHRPSQLSGGQQQRVAIARALLQRPRIVFADEPTGNLDTQSSAEVLEFLRRSVREFKQTTVMVTHDANAAAYADRVIFIVDGKVAHDLNAPTVDSILSVSRSLGAQK